MYVGDKGIMYVGDKGIMYVGDKGIMYVGDVCGTTTGCANWIAFLCTPQHRALTLFVQIECGRLI